MVTLDEIKSQLTAAGIAAACVVDAPPDGGDRLRFDRGLSEYLEVVRAVGSKIVIVYSQVLSAEEFLHASNVANVGSDVDTEADVEVIDLCGMSTDLRKFREFLGRPALFHLSIQVQYEYLDLVLEAPWWQAFLEERSSIIEQVDDTRQRKAVMESVAEAAEMDALMARLHKLADLPQFARPPTQKAMLQYALREIPELSEIDVKDLKAEIPERKARIDAAS